MKTIIIVEDEIITRMLITAEVKSISKKYNTVLKVIGSFSTGEEALPKILELKPDFIFMDINLGGGMDGIEVIIEVQKVIPEINFCYFSAEDELKKDKRLMSTNPSIFLKKPILNGRLIKLLLSL